MRLKYAARLHIGNDLRGDFIRLSGADIDAFTRPEKITDSVLEIAVEYVAQMKDGKTMLTHEIQKFSVIVDDGTHQCSPNEKKQPHA
jgi:hypothetical protein